VGRWAQPPVLHTHKTTTGLFCWCTFLANHRQVHVSVFLFDWLTDNNLDGKTHSTFGGGQHQNPVETPSSDTLTSMTMPSRTDGMPSNMNSLAKTSPSAARQQSQHQGSNKVCCHARHKLPRSDGWRHGSLGAWQICVATNKQNACGHHMHRSLLLLVHVPRP
jgi:hypothetical protein